MNLGNRISRDFGFLFLSRSKTVLMTLIPKNRDVKHTELGNYYERKQAFDKRKYHRLHETAF